MLDENQKREILSVLLEQAEVAKRLTTDASNDCGAEYPDIKGAINSQSWWWYPKYTSTLPSWAAWAAFAKRRKRFAWSMMAVSILVALIGNLLPEPIDHLMFIGFAMALALLATWQLDVSNRELEFLESRQAP